MDLKTCDLEVVDKVIASAIEVHKTIGPGLLETVYRQALSIEFDQRGVHHVTEIGIPASYRGTYLTVGFRADIIVEDSLLLELKVVRKISDSHVAQTITYLRLLGYKTGLILNFYNPRMVHGIRRISI